MAKPKTRTFQFQFPAEIADGLMLEQLANIHALLSTLLNLQMSLVASLTNQKFVDVRDHYISQLNEFQKDVVTKIQASIAVQPSVGKSRRPSNGS